LFFFLSEEDRAKAKETCSEHFMKFRHVRFEICGQTNKQTNRQTGMYAHSNTSHPFQGRINDNLVTKKPDHIAYSNDLE